MSQMRLNPLTGRWVTIVEERAERPTDFAPRTRQVEADPQRPCPFCPGHEEATLPALETVDEGGSWTMRVVPNLYPAFHGDAGFVVHHVGPVHVTAEASGIHEVFVYTPDHDGRIDQLEDAAAA
ncbi:MAG: galactose-1-phosphate uridylyltransferase, partial [Acidimicrobiia bacterium]|nr:galactose-1-phosphate uridylyltransferase [Acidimicrobiia bacterium]